MSERSRLCFPKLKNIQLQAFSLYEGNPCPTFECIDGVTCLVGANGVGKSTLLNAVSFALTGIVPDPAQAFRSFSEYYTACLPYAEKYFTGRITSTDKDSASVTLLFDCNGREYHLTRYLFNTGELEELTITPRSEDDPDPTKLNRRDKQLHFESELCKDTGFSSFAQYSCFQTCVCNFDEKRLLLLFSEKFSEQILNTVFLSDPEAAVKIDNLRREEEKCGSNIRNIQWEITKNLNRMRSVAQRTASVTEWAEQLTALETRHAGLRERLLQAETMSGESRGDLDDLTLELAQLAAEEASLRESFSEMLSTVVSRKPNFRDKPEVLKVLTTGVCHGCGQYSTSLQSHYRQLINSDRCPICESTIPKVEESAGNGPDALLLLDQQLSTVRSRMKDVTSGLQEARQKAATCEETLRSIEAELRQFESANLTAISQLRQSLNGTQPPAADDAASELGLIQQQQSEKEAAEVRRTELRQELANLRKSLREEFYEVEGIFVPLFKDLANKFLGVDIDIRLDDSARETVKLAVSVRGSTRRQSYALSESQKFFLDIAFRMALLQYAAHDSSATLYLDTPEGSLDIAYEKRAGDMLASFVSLGNNILMSANLNTSQLLLSVADHCREEAMRLVIVMDWASLTDVQRTESPLFDKALQNIKKAMQGGGI